MIMPLTVVDTTQKLLNSFVWGKKRWTRWTEGCYTYEEGGLNLKSLTDLNMVCMAKAWYRLREGSSLWSKFMIDKYCKHATPMQAKAHSLHSRVWKAIIKGRDYAEDRLHWILGTGDCFFWHDSWRIEGPPMSLDAQIDNKLRVKDLWTDHCWDIDKLRGLVSQEDIISIMATLIHDNMQDTLVWKGTQDGHFSFKNVYKEIAQSRPSSNLYGSLWHSSFPTNMSMLAWRICHNYIPSEDNLKRQGIQLASKCICCSAEETLAHIFIDNHVVQDIWNQLAYFFGFVQRVNTVRELFTTWGHGAACKGHVKQLIPIVATAAIWEARNKKKHDNQAFTFSTIWHRIVRTVQLWSMAGNDHLRQWKGALQFARAIGVRVLHPEKIKPQVVGWDRPTRARLKLNIDGSFGLQHGGAGGVLRDRNGDMIAAISMVVDASSPFSAEVEATAAMLSWCETNNYLSLQVEIDSLQLYHAITRGRGPWGQCSRIIHITRLLEKTHSTISHIWRERNKAADFMAKQAGLIGQQLVWRPGEELPRLRAIIRLEQLGVPYIRRRN